MAIRSSAKLEILARRLWAVGDSTRLRILNMLPAAPTEKCCHNVCTLGEKLNLAQSTVSHHLRILRQAGLIQGKRCCRDVYYWADEKAVSVLLKEFGTALAKPKRAKK